MMPNPALNDLAADLDATAGRLVSRRLGAAVAG
jgi:hypothetical protein